VVWAHGEEITKCRFPALARRALAGAAAILVNSDFTAARVRDLVGRRTPPVCKITLGATPAWARLPPAAVRGAGEAPVILTVARLCARDRYKGVDQALRACAELRRRGVAFRYRIVGEGDDRAWLEALAGSLGVADQVEFCGALPEAALLAAYDACDVFLLASREERQRRGLGFEGFGIVLLEAAARAKPVVAGRSGGIPDAVVEGATGVLVDSASPAAIADGVARVLGDAAWAAALGRAGRQRVLDEYNWDHAAAQVRALHQELLA
jgi:phosphatidylinositol alpha-1,6-mannosyltransferase